MTAYYNEFDPKAAAWIRELIKQKLIAPGEVDERSIKDVTPADLKGFTQCHFFAGIGGWSYALRLADWPDDRPVWTGSCPCQPFSKAGKGKAADDERHLWPAFRWLIAQVRPTKLFGEQVGDYAGGRWLSGVHSDMGAMGYFPRAANLCSAGVGAPDIRQRIYWVADSARERRKRHFKIECPPVREEAAQSISSNPMAYAWKILEEDSDDLLLYDGLSIGMARGAIKGYGNAINPYVAKIFIEATMK